MKIKMTNTSLLLVSLKVVLVCLGSLAVISKHSGDTWVHALYHDCVNFGLMVKVVKNRPRTSYDSSCNDN